VAVTLLPPNPATVVDPDFATQLEKLYSLLQLEYSAKNYRNKAVAKAILATVQLALEAARNQTRAGGNPLAQISLNLP